MIDSARQLSEMVYERIARNRCKWCRQGKPRSMPRFGNRKWYHYVSDDEECCQGGCWQPCTAPTKDALIEELAGKAGALAQRSDTQAETIRRMRGERDTAQQHAKALADALTALWDCWRLSGTPEEFLGRVKNGGLMDGALVAIAAYESAKPAPVNQEGS